MLKFYLTDRRPTSCRSSLPAPSWRPFLSWVSSTLRRRWALYSHPSLVVRWLHLELSISYDRTFLPICSCFKLYFPSVTTTSARLQSNASEGNTVFQRNPAHPVTMEFQHLQTYYLGMIDSVSHLVIRRIVCGRLTPVVLSLELFEYLVWYICGRSICPFMAWYVHHTAYSPVTWSGRNISTCMSMTHIELQ